MLVVINFDLIDEEQHASLKAALNLNVNVADWRRFFGNSYLLAYAPPDKANPSLEPLFDLCKTATTKEGKPLAHFAINALSRGYKGYGPKDLWNFVDRHSAGVTAAPVQTKDGQTLIKEKSPHIIDPEALILRDHIDLDSLMLEGDIKAAVQAQLMRGRFQQAAAQKGVRLPEAYQNVLISGKPGVGKSTLAKALALKLRDQMAADRKVPVYFVKPAQLIGAYRGHTQMNMQTLLDHAAGGIVILDEIDTYLDLDSDDAMILNVLNTHMGDKPNFPIVIGTMYEASKPRFMKFNQGFQRRFAHGFSVPAQDDARLMEILEGRIKDSGLGCEPAALKYMRELIHARRSAQGPNFGNIGEVNNILDIALKNMAQRFDSAPANFEFKILALDIPEYDPQSGRLKPRLPVPANDVTNRIATALAPAGSAVPSSNIVPLTFDKG